MCQRLDWSFHKSFCKAFKSLNPRPSEDHRLAFYFPIDLDPRLEWVRPPSSLHPDKNDEELDFPSSTVQWPYILARGGYVDGFLKLNHSIISFTKGAYWAGPLAVFRKERSAINSAIIQDVSLDDLPKVIRLLKQIGNGSQVMKPQALKQEFKTSRGVIIKCKGDKMDDPRPIELEVSNIPEFHPIFDGQPTNISKLMKIPLIIQGLPREARKNVVFDEDQLRNDHCGVLHLDVLSHSDTWGEIPSQWQNNVGTILVVRQDKKDITALQLLAIIAFIKRLDLSTVKDEPDVGTREEFLDNYFSKTNFEDFFFGCFASAVEIQNPQRNENLISPYSNSYDSVGLFQDNFSVHQYIDPCGKTGYWILYGGEN
ncbi:hypothetical protein ACHAP3_008181 [Botrytis cinerea]